MPRARHRLCAGSLLARAHLAAAGRCGNDTQLAWNVRWRRFVTAAPRPVSMRVASVAPPPLARTTHLSAFFALSSVRARSSCARCEVFICAWRMAGAQCACPLLALASLSAATRTNEPSQPCNARTAPRATPAACARSWQLGTSVRSAFASPAPSPRSVGTRAAHADASAADGLALSGTARSLVAALAAGLPLSVAVDSLLDSEGERVRRLANARTDDGVALYVAYPATVLNGRPAPIVLVVHQVRCASVQRAAAASFPDSNREP